MPEDKPFNEYAFPFGDHVHGGHPGMDLRDYFAGQALAGLCSVVWMGRAKAEDIARMAYADADAMLKERSK